MPGQASMLNRLDRDKRRCRMQLATALSDDVAEYVERSGTVLVPVGSLEQHWKAAPLGCDTIVPVRLCAEAGERTGAAVAPALSYGMSANHMCFPGTVSLRQETLRMVIEDIAVSMHAHGFRRILFLSGHGGNRQGVEEGIEAVCDTCPGLAMEYLLYRDLPGAVERQRQLFCPDPGYHVTVTEVSMIWYLLETDPPDFPRIKFPPEPVRGEVLSAQEWKERYPQGGAGSDLGHVSIEKGGEFFRFLVESLCEYIEESRSR